jgi:hypothetical protein
MTGATIDHIVSVIIFLAAILIFIGLFNQIIQTAILYQQHRYLATKCSDMLDGILLNPGSPTNETFFWGSSNCMPTGFGLQDPEFTEYRLSAFSLMRLNSASGSPVYYPTTGKYYSNVTTGFGKFMLTPLNQDINYSLTQQLLGMNKTYGFQFSVTPIITVSIADTSQSNPLTLAINVAGMGFPLANANVSYCLITVSQSGLYPAYTIRYGTVPTNSKGSVSLNLGIDGTQQSYVLIAYARLFGLTGVGYYEHVTDDSSYVIPFVSDFAQRQILIAHSRDVLDAGDPTTIAYNVTFVLLAEDFTLRDMPMQDCTGNVDSGLGTYATITVPTDTPGTLIITYSKNSNQSGIVMMPWGISAMAFPMIFGDNLIATDSKEWVATDTRQVIVGNVAYQAKLSLWSLEGYTVVS